MKKIYFLYTKETSWVNRDIEILSKKFNVKTQNNYKRAIGNLVSNFYHLVWCDLIFCWFASAHFFPSIFIAKLLNKKIVVVAGGYDVASVPDINYGGMLKNGIVKWFRKKVLNLADLVIAVSKSNQREIYENAEVPPSRVKLIYHGFSIPVKESWDTDKKNIVISIGEVKKDNFQRKGLLSFVKLSKSLPDIPFYLIGKWTDDSYKYLKEIAPENLVLTDFLENERFDHLLSEAKVVVQLSAHEAFGCSVAEAMLWGCIPVVSNRFALPEVVGDTGYIVEYGDIGQAQRAIQKALNNEKNGDLARERIINLFPLEPREVKLISQIEGLFK